MIGGAMKKSFLRLAVCSIYLTALPLLVGCGSKVGNNISETTAHGKFANITQQEFVWKGDCSPCAEVSENEWATTCSGRLVGQTGAYRLGDFTTSFKGKERNVCKVPRYQALKLETSKVVLTDIPKKIGLKLTGAACSCTRPAPHHVECTPSFTLLYLNDGGSQIGQQNFTGFSANTYCLGASGPKPCAPVKDKQVYDRCLEHSFGLFSALANQALYAEH